jgi:hypothetical protein
MNAPQNLGNLKQSISSVKSIQLKISNTELTNQAQHQY